MHGILYGVGVGPGDPRLMTFLAADTIKKCGVLAVPARTREQAVSYQIARGLLPELDQKACLSLAVPMTKDRTVLNAAYEQAADLVEEQLKAGKDVACLTLGDPTIYSTYIYLHRIIKARGYETQIIRAFPPFVRPAPVSETASRIGLSSFISFLLLTEWRRLCPFPAQRYL